MHAHSNGGRVRTHVAGDVDERTVGQEVLLEDLAGQRGQRSERDLERRQGLAQLTGQELLRSAGEQVHLVTVLGASLTATTVIATQVERHRAKPRMQWLADAVAGPTCMQLRKGLLHQVLDVGFAEHVGNRYVAPIYRG
jgi:hypothetical protein